MWLDGFSWYIHWWWSGCSRIVMDVIDVQVPFEAYESTARRFPLHSNMASTASSAGQWPRVPHHRWEDHWQGWVARTELSLHEKTVYIVDGQCLPTLEMYETPGVVGCMMLSVSCIFANDMMSIDYIMGYVCVNFDIAAIYLYYIWLSMLAAFAAFQFA